jgi:hypothetical protein
MRLPRTDKLETNIYPEISPPELGGWQGGFVQEKKNVKTYLLSYQPPSNEFGADSKSSLK